MSLNLNYKPDVFVENTLSIAHEEWLGYRRSGVGGSDSGAIMGVSPFFTKRDLYYDKIGRTPVVYEEDENWVQKEVGHRLEDLVAQIFSKKTGLTVYAERKMFRHPLYPFMLADVDYFVKMPDGKTAILECKTTSYHNKDKWENDAVPIHYEYQGRHYLSVMNMNVVYFACLFGNSENDFVYRKMERDLDIEEDMINEEAYFWNEQVKKRIEPPYTEDTDLVLESIKRYGGLADKDAAGIKLDDKHIISLKHYLELKEKKSALEAQVKRLNEDMKSSYLGIVEELGPCCSGVLTDGTDKYVITYNPRYTTTIDKKGLERLKNRHPDIFEEYISTTEARIFNVKKGKSA